MIARQPPGPRQTIDPELAPFVDALARDWARHPALETLSPAEARDVAERVRAPWIVGGPPMHRRIDDTVRCGDRTVPIVIHRPTSEPDLPVLLYLHGGGWTLFSTTTHGRIMREYAARAGVAVIGVEYSLAPEHRFPAPIEDTLAVLDWVRHSATALGLDSTRIAIGGDSAGAHITVGTALTLRDARAPQVQALILNYGAYDTDFTRPSCQWYGDGSFTLSLQEMDGFWRGYLGNFDLSDPRARPLHADLSRLPPTFMAITELDPLHDENVALAEALERAGVSVDATVYPGTMHSFLEAVSIAAVSDRAFRDTALWLRRPLRISSIVPPRTEDAGPARRERR